MQRASYEVDPFNRLIIDKTGTEGGLSKFRQVLDGRFALDGDNNLSYRVKAPLSEDENIPHQLMISGDWSLTDGHELRLTLDKEGRETFGDQITLRGQILDVGKDSLIFSITTKSNNGTQSTYILNLQGFWRADENNRLSFYIRKEEGRYDILTFNGAWEVNKNHRIIYQYEKAALIRKKKESHTLVFEGYWDVRDKFRIAYVLDETSGSVFDFKSSIGILGDDYIKYDLGIGLAHETKPVRRTVTLFGEWKLKKDTGILFEIEYEDKKSRAIVFGADVKLTSRDTVLFRLKDSVDNKDLEMTLELSHKILEKDGEAFLRALASKGELGCYAGMAWRW